VEPLERGRDAEGKEGRGGSNDAGLGLGTAEADARGWGGRFTESAKKYDQVFVSTSYFLGVEKMSSAVAPTCCCVLCVVVHAVPGEATYSVRY
jgi:hypothetical protein